MTAWPDGLPFFDLRSGHSAQPGVNVRRTPMDAGEAKARRRFTSTPSVVTGMAYMTREEAQRFEAFYRDTLFDGALRFTKTDGQWRRRNLLVQSEDFSAGWALGGLIRSDAASVIPGGTASRLQNPNISAPRIRQTGVLSGQAETLTIVTENDDAASTTFGIFDLTADAWVVAGRLTWATGAIVVSNGTGSVSAQNLGTGPNGGALYRLTTTGTGTSGNAREINIFPGATPANTTASILHWAQLETAPAFTTYEPVGESYPATHVTRGGEKTYRIVEPPRFDLMGLGHGVPVTLEVIP